MLSRPGERRESGPSHRCDQREHPARFRRAVYGRLVPVVLLGGAGVGAVGRLVSREDWQKGAQLQAAVLIRVGEPGRGRPSEVARPQFT